MSDHVVDDLIIIKPLTAGRTLVLHDILVLLIALIILNLFKTF